jgi:UDP-glucose 4-epimerase
VPGANASIPQPGGPSRGTKRQPGRSHACCQITCFRLQFILFLIKKESGFRCGHSFGHQSTNSIERTALARHSSAVDPSRTRDLRILMRATGRRLRSRYLVTGGCGFIGSHLADRLVDQGHQVRILDNLSSGQLDNAPAEAEVIVGDVGDPLTVRRALHNVDGCFHLAAVASVTRCNTEPLAANRTNLAGTLNVLSIAATGGVPVVYASSAAVYGANLAIPLVEGSATQPLSVYAADKLGCEVHASVASHFHGIRTVGLRLFNVYGPRQDPSSPYSGVISIFISRAQNRQELEVFGDGQQVRDFVFVDDVVSAFVAAMEKQDPGASICNVCTGEGTTVLALAQLVSELAGQPARIRYGAPRAGEVRTSIGHPRRLTDYYGIVPAISLRVGLVHCLRDVERANPTFRRSAASPATTR